MTVARNVLLAALAFSLLALPGAAQAPFDMGGGGATDAPLRGAVTDPAPATPPPSAAPTGAPAATAPEGGVPFFTAAPPDNGGAATGGGGPGSPTGGTAAGGAGSPFSAGGPGDEPRFDMPATGAPAASPFTAAPPSAGGAPPPSGGSPFSVGGGDAGAGGGAAPFRIDPSQTAPATPGRSFSASPAPAAGSRPAEAPSRPAPSSAFSVAPPDPNSTDGATPFQMQLGQPQPAATGQPPTSGSPFSPNFVPDRDEAPIEPAQTAAQGVDRPVLPRPDLRLTGEIDFTIITAYLSAAEAARPAVFSIGIVNSVLVMPEASRLRVVINGRAVTDMQINSPGRAGRQETPLPQGLLKPGPNTIRIEATQRHRVDCSLRATYELWTLLVPSLTGFIFQGGPVPVNGLGDLAAIGVDDSGATRINVVPVGPTGPERLSRIAAAVSAASVFGRFDHPVAKIVDAGTRLERRPGHLTLVVGTAAAVRQVTEIAAGEAAARPVVALMPDPRTQVPTLVVSGPTPEDVDRALARLSVQAERSAVERPDRRFPWRSPDVPVFRGGEAMSLAELGLQTTEFSGRRFQTHFDVGLPDDFYAAAYGEANLLLDAAFTPEVRAGSTIDVYVNQALAVTVNITSQDGGLFDQRLVKIPLRNFRPGPNRVHIEANLSTEADDRCLPGATMPGRERFVMFSSSIFRVAPFARFGELPNLAAFAAGAFPYRDGGDAGGGPPIPVYLAGEGPSSIGAAATLMARLSVSTGVPLPNRFLSNAVELEGQSAVIVGAAPDLDPQILDAAGLTNVVRGAWATPATASGTAAAAATPDEYESVLARLRALRLGIEPETPVAPSADRTAPLPQDTGGAGSEVYERWRTGVGGTGVSDVVQQFTDWLRESFGLTLDMLHLAEAENRTVRLAPRTTVVVAQARGPGAATSTWTVVTAPSGPLLASGVEGITAPQTWFTMDGSVAAYQETTGLVQDFFPGERYHVQTVPFSFQNARLIAANWFSINVLEYALALMLSSGSLGIVSWVLIRQIGRENNA
ncbi:cellulose biosynthesis cyclic di-GMP-binding regulatory protein BcsB [Pseudoxanthobacter sp. M-2]|uniref:cellulose biosynthesis cyclic di-GMP-binding regulatory protein BcsB n=1 Tax=Pseudoxanthobacter sp. M-2 TaxID=3078754 RepID=UPI0038FC8C28